MVRLNVRLHQVAKVGGRKLPVLLTRRHVAHKVPAGCDHLWLVDGHPVLDLAAKLLEGALGIVDEINNVCLVLERALLLEPRRVGKVVQRHEWCELGREKLVNLFVVVLCHLLHGKSRNKKNREKDKKKKNRTLPHPTGLGTAQACSTRSRSDTS